MLLRHCPWLTRGGKRAFCTCHMSTVQHHLTSGAMLAPTTLSRYDFFCCCLFFFFFLRFYGTATTSSIQMVVRIEHHGARTPQSSTWNLGATTIFLTPSSLCIYNPPSDTKNNSTFSYRFLNDTMVNLTKFEESRRKLKGNGPNRF